MPDRFTNPDAAEAATIAAAAESEFAPAIDETVADDVMTEAVVEETAAEEAVDTSEAAPEAAEEAAETAENDGSANDEKQE